MILITGASSGIGEACAHAYAAQGHSLILVARRNDRLQAVAREISARYSTQSYSFALDVTDRAEVETFFKTHKELLGRVEILVNNAGLARGLDPIQSGNLDDWETMIDTNIKGLLYFTHGILPFMLEKNRGHIVNLGSVAGRWTYPKGNIYSATKFAVRALSESLRMDLNGTPIRVTEIAPGMVETEFSEVRLRDPQKAKAVYAGMTPLSAQDVAEAVVWSTSRPAHVNIQEIVLYPVDQASPMLVHRPSIPPRV